MKFRTWLKKQEWREDVVGDLSRDVTLDGSFPLMADWRGYLNYLYGKGASDEAIDAFKVSWDEYWDWRTGVEHEAARISAKT